MSTQTGFKTALKSRLGHTTRTVLRPRSNEQNRTSGIPPLICVAKCVNTHENPITLHGRRKRKIKLNVCVFLTKLTRTYVVYACIFFCRFQIRNGRSFAFPL